jgi:glucosamine-phosphate N-acetyltransferase
MFARKLEKGDFHKGFMSLINEFTPNPEPVNYDIFCLLCDADFKTTFVVESNEVIIATSSVIIEPKFHHNFMNVAHIEDVIVNSIYRGFGLGTLIVEHILDFVKDKNCYKIILNCSEYVAPFYLGLGFCKSGIQMRIGH